MIEVIDDLRVGFSVAIAQQNIIYCLFGAILGTVVGVLPGMNPVIVISVLLPLTFNMPAAASLIMLAGIYYGSHHSGATCAIMLNMPGEPSSLVICLDGHPMARQGRAGPALFIAALASFVAGCVCIVLVAVFSPPIARAALEFQAPEYAAIVLLALVGSAALSGTSPVSTLGMGALGLLLGTIGPDINSGILRFTFDEPKLSEGLDFIAIAVGLFAMTEIAFRLGRPEGYRFISTASCDLVPRAEDLRMSWKPVLRGTVIGAALGMLPGIGPLMAAFASYGVERRLSSNPARFGEGAIEGIAGPEAADNAAAITHFIPMLTLGIPAGATFALLLGAMLLHGVHPGPQLMTQHPELFWGLIASMWIGNLMLLILNLPLVGLWIKLLQIPYRFLFPVILVFSCIGIYSIRNEPFDIVIGAIAGVVGFLLRKWDCAPAPLILGLILGRIMEENLRRSLLLSGGDPTIFIRRPISLAIVLLAAFLIAILSVSAIRRQGGNATERGSEEPVA